MDLEVAGADRRLHPVPVAARVGEGLRDGRLARAVEPEHAALRRRRLPPESVCIGSDSIARGQSRCSSPGGPGSTTTTQLPASSTTPGAVPAMPSETAPSGSVACFRTPGAKSAYGRRMRSANRREICSISASSASSTCSATACDARHELDRPVVVGRPEATRDEADVGFEPLAQRRLELVRVVADDRDARRLETEAQRFLSVERAVEIGSLAPDELAARHDDCCAGARQELGVIVRCPLAGTLTRTPATRTTTLRGDATESQSLRDANRFVCPRWSVPR